MLEYYEAHDERSHATALQLVPKGELTRLLSEWASYCRGGLERTFRC